MSDPLGMKHDLIALRHALHRQPELSGAEAGTAALITDALRGTAPDRLVTGLGGHGVAAVYDSGQPGPTVMFRAELDALPIPDASGVAHASQRPGLGHLCGHDGHMAILMGLAGTRPARGRMVLLFQPAEETGAGARAVLADPRLWRAAPRLCLCTAQHARLALGGRRRGGGACQLRVGRLAHCAYRA